MAKIRLLGIDPGSRVTGYGLISIEGIQKCYIDSGCIRTTGYYFPGRLKTIFEVLTTVICMHKPNEVAIEQVFVNNINPDSAIKLCQARGAAICAVVMAGLPISEYSPSVIKQAIVGDGAAKKKQIKHMIQSLLHLSVAPPTDAADALAVAICHGHNRQTQKRITEILVSLSR